MDFSEGLLLLLGPPIGWIVALVWGALWGSFFNVCIYRIAVHESVVWPPSRCPGCRSEIAPYDNIPVLSWLILRGRCRRCKQPISPRYLVIEALTAALTAAIYGRFVASGEFPLPVAMMHFIVYFYFTGTLIVLSGIDADYQILPDSITYPAIPIFFLLGRLLGDIGWHEAAIGSVVGYLFVRGIADGYYYLTGREGMGYGDGKLLALTAGLLGWKSLPITLLVGSVTGMLVSVPLLVLRRQRERRAQAGAATADTAPDQTAQPPLRHIEVPFGPFLAVGALVYMFVFAGRDYETVLLHLFGGF